MTGIPTPVEEQSVIELCGGPGGMSEGQRLAGLPSGLAVGIDTSKDACETAEKAGHRRIHASVSVLSPFDVAREFGMPHGIHGSPPCPGFSTAGKGKGRADLDLLRAAAEAIGAGENADGVIAHVVRHQQDPRSSISLEPMRWALALRPEWITLEQVPSVLPLWEVYAEVLRKYGYSVWTGNITAEQFGVPQTRRRAVLLASRVLPMMHGPVATHSKFHTRTPAKLDPGVRPWVSMAEALGWGMIQRPYPTVAAGTAAGGADPQMLGGSGARLIVARAREAGDGHWVERPMHPVYGPVSFLGSGLANDQGQRARSGDEPSHTIVGKGTATWRFDEIEGTPYVGFPRRYDGRGDVVEIDGEQYRGRDFRSIDDPSFAVTEKMRSAEVHDLVDDRFDDLDPTHMGDVYNSKGTVRPLGHPAMTMTASMDNNNFKFIDPQRVSEIVRERLNNQSGTLFDEEWPAYRPAQVVASRDLNTAPGANGNRFNGSKKSRNDGVRVLDIEAAALQSFRSDYWFAGTKTSRFQQIGDAVPPLMGEAMIRCVTGQHPALPPIRH